MFAVVLNSSKNEDNSSFNLTVLTEDNMLVEMLDFSGLEAVVPDLEEDTTYLYCLCSISGGVCCSGAFTTPAPAPDHRVVGVRAHIYHPVLGSSEITAQIVWQQLQPDSLSIGYRVSITRQSVHISGSPFEISGSNTNYLVVQNKDERQILDFPLKNGCSYSVQVQGVTANGDLPQSDTLNLVISNDSVSLTELYLVQSQTRSGSNPAPFGASLLVADVNSVILQINTAGVGSPLAIDIARRTLFFYNPDTLAIHKTIINIPFNSQSATQTFSTKPDTLIVPLAMAYDWLARKLYLAGTNSDVELEIWSLTDIPSENVIMDRVYLGSAVPLASGMQMTVNPFSGFIHWIQNSESGESIQQLHQLDLRSGISRIVSEGNFLVTLAQDTFRESTLGCLLVYETTGVIQYFGEIMDSQKCLQSVQVLEGPSANEGLMVLDEMGLFLAIPNTLIHLSENVSFIPFGFTAADVEEIKTASPGTQPLPNDIRCLSPDFSMDNNRPQASVTQNEDVVHFEWNVPTDRPPDCAEQLFSTAPLEFRVYLENEDGALEGYDPKILFESSLSVELPPGTYSITVEARTDFTLLPADGDTLAGPSVTFVVGENSIMPMETPTSPESQPFPLAVVIAAGVVTMIVVIIIVVSIAGCCLYKKKWKPKDIFTPSAPQRPPASSIDGIQCTQNEQGAANTPFYLPVLQPSEFESTYEDCDSKERQVEDYPPGLQSSELERTYEDCDSKILRVEDKYTALNSLTRDKNDSSQYTPLIKPPSQTMGRNGDRPNSALINNPQASEEERSQSKKTPENIEPYDYVSFVRLSAILTQSDKTDGDSTQTEQTHLSQDQDELYY